ncbi:MAG TPA: hypothetical protein VGE74_14710 [Gemmata sp.]
MTRARTADSLSPIPDMHLIHILLPLDDNKGKALPKRLFRAVADELTEKFGGLTAHTRAPAEGLWKQGSSEAAEDEIVIYEVMAEGLDEAWWTKYRKRLEKRFKQEKVIVRAQEVRVL